MVSIKAKSSFGKNQDNHNDKHDRNRNYFFVLKSISEGDFIIYSSAILAIIALLMTLTFVRVTSTMKITPNTVDNTIDHLQLLIADYFSVIDDIDKRSDFLADILISSQRYLLASILLVSLSLFTNKESDSRQLVNASAKLEKAIQEYLKVNSERYIEISQDNIEIKDVLSENADKVKSVDHELESLTQRAESDSTRIIQIERKLKKVERDIRQMKNFDLQNKQVPTSSQ